MAQFEKNGNHLRVSGAMTVESVNALLDESIAAFTADNSLANMAGSQLEMDLSGVTDADSAAIALMFEWLRRAHSRKAHVVFTNLPANLVSLATLYGVLEFIPQQSSH